MDRMYYLLLLSLLIIQGSQLEKVTNLQKIYNTDQMSSDDYSNWNSILGSPNNISSSSTSIQKQDQFSLQQLKLSFQQYLNSMYEGCDSLIQQRYSEKKQKQLNLLKQDSEFCNSLVVWMVPGAQHLSFFFQTWLRNFVAANLVYFGVGSVWIYYCYYVFKDDLYENGKIPKTKDILMQARVSFAALPLYSLLPTVTEEVVIRGWSRAYARLDQVSLQSYLINFVLYMVWVEFGVYWVHRLLHEIPFLYKNLHSTHHIYNKQNTLSPFAGLAFHPIDGVLQAMPYNIGLLLVPMHFLTHELLLFATGIWTINIHDCIHGRARPILGAGYHLIHHTAYTKNYGHYFTFMDQIFGTLEHPEDFYEKKQELKKNL